MTPTPTRLKLPNARTEAEFRQNRRVVFYVRQVTFLPPPPAPPEPPRSVIEDRFTAQLLRAQTVTVAPLPAPPRPAPPGVPNPEGIVLQATLEIVDTFEKKQALFSVQATGTGLSTSPTKVGASLTLSPGPVVKFKTFRLLGAGAGNVSLKSFEGAVTVFVDGGSGAGPVSAGGTLSFVFDALPKNGANHMPSIIRLPGGDGLVSPGVSFGDVLPLGRMSITGSIQNL